MTSQRNVALRAVQVGVGLATAASGTAALMVRRRASAVRESDYPELDAALDPPEMNHRSFATSDGGVVHYVDSQPGADPDTPTVILLHGISLQWWIWSAVIRELRSDYRVLAWDMRGFGASRAGSSGVSIAAAANDLASLGGALKLRDTVVVGHSMGGMVLGRFLVDHSVAVGPGKQVAGALFLDTTARSLDGSLRTGGLVRLSKVALGASKVGVSSKSVSWKDNDLSIVLLRGGFGRIATKRMLDDMRRCQSEASAVSMRQGSESIAAHDVLEGLRRTTIPAVVMVGGNDRLTPPLHSEQLHRALANSSLVVLPQEGHNVMQENPAAVCVGVRELFGRMKGALS